MQNPNNIIEPILSLEKRLNLFDWDFLGVKIWELIRLDIYLSGYDNSQSKGNAFVKLIKLKYYILNIVLNSPLTLFKKADYLIFESSRYIYLNNSYVDIYTASVKEQLIKEKKNFKLLHYINSKEQYLSKNENSASFNLLYLFSKAVKLYLILSKTTKIKKRIKELPLELKNYDTNLNLTKLIKTKYIKVISEEVVFSLYFKIIKPQKIYLIAYNGREGMIAAAKKLGIPLVEIQHGVLSKYNLVYSFPSFTKNKLQFFPTFFLYHSFFSKQVFYLPLSVKYCEISDKTYLDYVKRIFGTNGPKIKKSIAFISQTTVMDSLLKVIQNNIEDLKDYNIYYRAHPNENVGDQILELTRANPNFSISNKNENFFEFVSKIEICIGVYSAALIDAIIFNCKVYLLNIEGVQFLDDYKEEFSILNPILKIRDQIEKFKS